MFIKTHQVSSARVDDVAEILQKGERVWCKIISIGDDDKIGLSMKYVNQGSGTDLDPNGVELQRDMQKRKTIEKHERKTIHLEAVLNTTCTKCGTAGHLSKDCFMSPGGKKYELIPEIEEEQPIVQPQTDDVTKKEKKHKEKRKKKKKVKKYKQNTDDCDSVRKEIVKKKKKKYSKDQKRRGKKHNNSFSDESSNESLSSHDVKAHKRKHSDNIDKHSRKSKHSKNKHSND